MRAATKNTAPLAGHAAFHGLHGTLEERAIAIDAHLLAIDIISLANGRDDWIADQGRNLAQALRLWASLFDRFGPEVELPAGAAAAPTPNGPSPCLGGSRT